MGAKGERWVQTKRRSRRVRLVAEPWSVVLPSSVPKPKQPPPTRKSLLWPETDDEDEEEEEDAKVEILGSSGEESGWMDGSMWMGWWRKGGWHLRGATSVPFDENTIMPTGPPLHAVKQCGDCLSDTLEQR